MNSEQIKLKFDVLKPFLNERQRRIYAAAEARALGHGGVTLVSLSTGISRRAITQGCKELEEGEDAKLWFNAARKTGGGRKTNTEKQPGLFSELEKLIEPYTRGDPDSPLKWTCKSTRKLSDELKASGFQASHDLVARLLKEAGYSSSDSFLVLLQGHFKARHHSRLQRT